MVNHPHRKKSTEDDPMEQLSSAIAEMLTECLASGEFKAPLYIVAIGGNGTTQAYRGAESSGTGLDMSMLAEHDDDGQGFRLPINLFVTDNTGKAARMLIEQTNKHEMQILH